METKVKIIKDTVAHRIPVGSIVKIRDNHEIRKDKKCYNVVDYSCYISEDDFEILDKDNKQNPTNSNPIDSPKIDKTTDPILFDNLFNKNKEDWFDDYAKKHYNTKYYQGQKVKAVKVNKLTPNGTTGKAKDGEYIIYEVDKTGRYWLRSHDKTDINEYFCTEDSILGIVKNGYIDKTSGTSGTSSTSGTSGVSGSSGSSGTSATSGTSGTSSTSGTSGSSGTSSTSGTSGTSSTSGTSGGIKIIVK